MSRHRFTTLVGVVIVLSGCGPHEASATSPTPPRTAATPLESPTPTPTSVTVLYQEIQEPPAYGGLHKATVTNALVTEGAVVPSHSAELATSTVGNAVVALQRAGTPTVTNGTQPGTIDLETGVLRLYDLGPGSVECIIRSPDSTHLLVCNWPGTPATAYVDLDLATGVARPIISSGPGTGVGRPLAWTSRGIYVGCGSPACPGDGILIIDPISLATTPIGLGGSARGVSASGDYIGVQRNSFGESYGCQDTILLAGPNLSTSASGTREGSLTEVAAERNKDLRVVDVGDHGTVLYTEADCTSPHSPVATPSLYFYSGGASTLQAGLTVYTPGFFLAASQSQGALVGESRAVVEQRHFQFGAGVVSSELDLVELCSTAGCQPGLTVITRGSPPIASYAFSVLSG